MKILLVKPRHIGDSLIMTPTIRAIRCRYPDSQVWVLVRSSCDGILHGCPGIDRIITTARPESGKRKLSTWFKDFRIIRELQREHFDYAIDLGESVRGRWICVLAMAKQSVTSFSSGKPFPLWKRFFTKILDFTCYPKHRVLKDFQTAASLLDLKEPPSPLVFEKKFASPSQLSGLSDDNFVFIHPGTRWKRKQWPLEKWVELCSQLKELHSSIVISTGKDEKELSIARGIKGQIGSKIILTEGSLTWEQSAGLLYRARVFIGVDTAMSHLAAACQCPSVVLFGATYEGAWRPWMAPHKVVIPMGCEELLEDMPPEKIWSYTKRATADISVQDVISAYREMACLRL